MDKCPSYQESFSWSYRGVRLTFVHLTEVFLWERHLPSAGISGSVRLREVSVLWDVRYKRFYCSHWSAEDKYSRTSLVLFNSDLNRGEIFSVFKVASLWKIMTIPNVPEPSTTMCSFFCMKSYNEVIHLAWGRFSDFFRFRVALYLARVYFVYFFVDGFSRFDWMSSRVWLSHYHKNTKFEKSYLFTRTVFRTVLNFLEVRES